MTAFEVVSKRVRPALGTLLSIEVKSTADESVVQNTISKTFEEIEKLEKALSFFDSQSVISKINSVPVGTELELSGDVYDVLSLAEELWKASKKTFTPYQSLDSIEDDASASPLNLSRRSAEFFANKKVPVVVDLGGIAKGFIVDRAVESITNRLPDASGVVNAGGDLRFFGNSSGPHDVGIRIGGAERLYLREWKTPKSSVATSSPLGKTLTEKTSTQYVPGAGRLLRDDITVVAAAQTCGLADAFTKIGLFAPIETIDECCALYSVDLLIFDLNGQLVQAFGGAHENL